MDMEEDDFQAWLDEWDDQWAENEKEWERLCEGTQDEINRIQTHSN